MNRTKKKRKWRRKKEGWRRRRRGRRIRRRSKEEMMKEYISCRCLGKGGEMRVFEKNDQR